jgi:hypothetical protein
MFLSDLSGLPGSRQSRDLLMMLDEAWVAFERANIEAAFSSTGNEGIAGKQMRHASKLGAE